MKLLESLLEDKEIKRIDRYMEHCKKLAVNGKLNTSNEESLIHDMLLILDNQKIEAETLFVITEIMVLGNYWINKIPVNPNWEAISNELVCNFGVALSYDGNTARFRDEDKYMTFAEMLSTNQITPNCVRTIMDTGGNVRRAKLNTNGEWIYLTPHTFTSLLGKRNEL